MLLTLRKSAAPALLLFAAACSGIASVPDSPQASARRALNALVQNYELPRAEAFFDQVDDSRFPSFDAFRERVRQFQIDSSQITLDVIVDAVDVNANALGVRAHWNKSYVTQQGMHKLESGQCEFMFLRQPSGGALLTAVQGASPF
jgi:hypothetical protein